VYTSLPTTPDIKVEPFEASPGYMDIEVKKEDTSLPGSGQGLEDFATPKMEKEGDHTEVGYEGYETPNGSIQADMLDNPGLERGRSTVKWVKQKKPLRELCNKIMIELRRKDEVSPCSTGCWGELILFC
jgi:hypothetical protein